MKKSFKKIMASLLVAVMVLSVSPIGSISEIDFSSLFSIKAAALTSGDFTYEVSGENATITGYSGTASNLTIPSKLDGKTVVAINENSFTGNSNLKKVTLPDTLLRISSTEYSSRSGAFQDCKKLESVTITAGSKDAVIGYNTFRGCSSLSSISIPGNYKTIYNDAFNNCGSLKSMVWSKSDYETPNQSILGGAFANCPNLESASLPTTLSRIDAYAFQNCGLKSIIVPEGVVSIGEEAFYGNQYLTKATLPSTLTVISSTEYTSRRGAFQDCKKLEKVTITAGTKDAVIGYNTFRGCSSLSSISIPGNYKTIYNDAFNSCTSLKSMVWNKSDYSYTNQVLCGGAFANCTNLESASLPTTLSRIDAYAFQNCGLKSIVVPEGVVSVGEEAFYGNQYLTSATLPSTLTVISSTEYTSRRGAFQDCKKLESVTITAGAKDAVIGYNTFKGCSSLSSISIPGNYKTIYNDAFNSCTSLKSMVWNKSDYSYANQVLCGGAFANCTNLETASLPTTLSRIDGYSFQNCGLKSIIVPEGVVSIGEEAFYGNKNLTTASLPSTLTVISSTEYTSRRGAFQDCTNLNTVIITEGSKNLTIGYNTFRNCPGLSIVHLPLNLVDIKSATFEGSTANLTICSKSNDSYAKKFANNNSINFKLCDGSHTAIGDVNGDGQINSSDALLVLQHAVKKITLTGNAFTAADTNKDKQLNSSDALKILQFSVGKIKEF